MDFDTYVRWLRLFLPKEQREDIVRELSEEYESHVAERETALGRPLNRDEQAALIKQFGHPLLSAARYRPQHYLVSPTLFPLYWPAVKVTLAIVLATHAVSGLVLLAGGASWIDLARTAGKASTSALATFAWLTIIFAVLDRRLNRSRVFEDWNPRQPFHPGAHAAGAVKDAARVVHRALGVLPHYASRPEKPASISGFVTVLVLSVWWVLALKIPALMFGGGAMILDWGRDMNRLYPVLVIAQLTLLVQYGARLTHADDTGIRRVTRAIWSVTGLFFLYYMLTLDHQWVVWRDGIDAQLRGHAMVDIGDRQWSLVDFVNYAFTIPFVAAFVFGASELVWRLFAWRRDRRASGAVTVALLSSVLVWPVSAQIPSDAEIRQILTDRIERERQSLGIVVGIVTPTTRRVIAHGRFGQQDARLVGGDTIFEIGSVTKVFTSVLLADMARRGEVNLNDPMRRYLPAELATRPNNVDPAGSITRLLLKSPTGDVSAARVE